MARVSWRGRIVIAETVSRREACFKGTQVPVRHVVACLADGMTPQQIVDVYPQITEDDVWAAMSYSADALAHGLTPTGRRRIHDGPKDEDLGRFQRAVESGKIERLGPRKWRYNITPPDKGSS